MEQVRIFSYLNGPEVLELNINKWLKEQDSKIQITAREVIATGNLGGQTIIVIIFYKTV